MEEIYKILRSLFGESKQGGYFKDISQYQFNSPWATMENNDVPDGKYNLEVSFSRGLYHEWVTGYGGTLSKLIRKFGGNDKYKEYLAILSEIKESRYYDLSNFKDAPKDSDAFVQLPKTFKRIELDTYIPSTLIDYLNKRNIGWDIIDKFNLGYTTWDEEKWQLRNRLIIPSYDEYGNLNYWVGRDYTGNPKKVKYLNCTADKKEIIYQESQLQWDGDLFIVEGAIDALYAPNTTAFLGKVLTNDSTLYSSIKERANAKVIICLDGDTNFSETVKICQTLQSDRLKGKIWYINLREKSKYKDFGEIYQNEGKKGIISTMMKMEQYVQGETELKAIF